ncbi:hypothetical protein CHL67_09320 [Prosthecochloris sp. GSB1]|uniref:alpha/beta hydrolase n=1 Tax=Prosthecochloris sp. GSB1 TaxID=281093 RepID=UPI000B8CF99E|nr:alpha/beta hydrolase [Prosthecochloris sp. GSB1]ASQ91088.1 hypothetical protein CHL67_09320 [Prosthecochloris sp. GSB1]
MMSRTFHSGVPAVFLLLFLCGCASGAATALTDIPQPPVRLFYVADRNDSGSQDPGERYGGRRGVVSRGECVVSFPHDHRIGELERPILREDVSEHVVLSELDVLDRERFFRAVAEAVGRSPRKRLLVYVHGYNMTFEKAALRMAQVTSDLGFTGCPVLFSWPSLGKVGGYTVDETNVKWSEPHLAELLGDLSGASGARHIFLIAHSMGNRLLVNAFLRLLGERPEYKALFRGVFLTAPDIDAELFRRDIAGRLAESGARITLYASGDDRALRLSNRIHGNPRAGYVDGIPLVVPGIETIDATGVDTGMTGHSYYNDSRPVLSDMYYILNEDLGAESRFSLEAVETGDGCYWRFKE